MINSINSRRRLVFFCLWLCAFSFWMSGCFLEPLSLDGFPCASNEECPNQESCIRGKCYIKPPTIKPDTCKSITDCACGATCNTTTSKCEDISCTTHTDCRGNSACQWFCNNETGKCQSTEPPPPPECTKDDECKACDTSCDLTRKICRVITCKEDKDCRCGYFCHDDGRCRKDAPAKQCSQPEDCESRRCFDGRCLGPCSSNNDCTNGRVCRNKRCERPMEGEPCDSKIGCEGDSLCIDDNGKGTCRKLCHPLNKNECKDGKICMYLGRSVQGQPLGVCKDKKAGKNLGEVCSDSLPCTTGLHCATDGQQKTCRKLCSPSASPSECPSGEQCLKVFAGQNSIGVCMKATCETVPDFCKPGNVCYQGTCRRSCKNQATICSSSQFCSDKSASVSVCEGKACNYAGKVCDLSSTCTLFECKKLPSPTKTCISDASCTSPQRCGEFKSSSRNIKHCLTSCKVTVTDDCKKKGLSNHLCVPFPSKTTNGSVSNYCMPVRGGGSTGASCDALKPCEWNHLCINLSSGSACMKLCDPRYKTNNVSCPPQHECFGLTSPKIGVCVNRTPRNNEQICGPLNGSCRSGYSCVIEKDGKTARCRKECKTTFGCKSGERCVGIQGSSKSVCVKP